MSKWFCEIVKDFDGTYYANLTIDGKLIKGLAEYVKYNELKKSIREQTGICIVNKKNLIFQGYGRKKYAFIDATQPCKHGSIVTLDEIISGHRPVFD